MSNTTDNCPCDDCVSIRSAVVYPQQYSNTGTSMPSTTWSNHTWGTNIPYNTIPVTKTPLEHTVDELRMIVDDLKRSYIAIMEVFSELVKKDCENGGECERCLPCKARQAFMMQYRESIAALAKEP